MEVWKDVKDYPGYEVSNLGNIKSFKLRTPRTKNLYLDKEGYLNVNLYCSGIGKSKRVHQLVAIAFLNHVKNGYHSVINHKDFNRQNNNATNLEITTNRINTDRKHIKSSSKYVGVCWDKSRNKWRSQIRINNKKKHLGYFENELEASIAYEQSIKNTTK